MTTRGFASSVGIGLAVVLSVAALLVAVSSGAPVTDGNFAGNRAGLQEFVDGIKAGDLTTKWVGATLPARSDDMVIYTNRTGRDVYADFGSVDVVTGETASSTYKISLFATTTTSVASSMDFSSLAEGKRALIQSLAIATSTTASSTSSVYAAARGASSGNGSIVIPDGSSLMVYLQQDTTAGSITCARNGACETATSSNRGFNPRVKVRLITFGLSL